MINYTGDRIHFGLATERARREGIKVEMFVNGEEMVVKGVKFGSHGEKIVMSSLEKMTSILTSMEGRLNELDNGCGDGDCGLTLAIGPKQFKQPCRDYPMLIHWP